MISLEPRPVGMWVPCPLPDKEILLCWDNDLEGIGLGLENQRITVNSWHTIRSSLPQHHDWLSHSPASCTVRTEGTFPGWGVKITTCLDPMPKTGEAKPPLSYMSPYHDTKLSRGKSPLNVLILQNVAIFSHLATRVHPTLYSEGYAQGQVQIRSA